MSGGAGRGRRPEDDSGADRLESGPVRKTTVGSQRLLLRELLGGAAVGLGKGRVAEANAWGVGRGALRPTNMSAFLFKQTETAGAPCACAARAFGRGTSRASRARTQAPVRAGLPRRGRGCHGGPDGGGPFPASGRGAGRRPSFASSGPYIASGRENSDKKKRRLLSLR